MNLEEIKEIAYKYALKNAIEHNGKAELNAVIGKVIALKGKEKGFLLQKIIHLIQEAINKANLLTIEEQKLELERFGELELKKPVKRIGLPELDLKGEVITRYAPNPNSVMHLGNARQAIINFEYAKKHNGKFFLRFDDTDPKIKVPMANAKKIFLEDLEWLGIIPDEIFFASNRLEIYYEFMKKLILMEKAFVCLCDVKKWRSLKNNKKACDCRKLNKEEHLKRFNKMLSHEFKEGKAALILKTDLSHKDPSVRDYVIGKIVDKPKHEKKEYHLWPTFNFQSAIDDHELGITLIIRGQEHSQNSVKQKFIYDYFNWVMPKIINTGRLSVKGKMLSGSKIKEGIEKNEFSSYSDPRLYTIKALKRRGFQAKAIKKLITEINIKPNDVNITEDRLIAFNKEVIGENYNKFVFIKEPIELNINYSVAMTIKREINKNKELFEEIELKKGTEKVFIEKNELEPIEEKKSFRLKDAFNVKLSKKNALSNFAEFTGIIKTSIPTMLWLKDFVSAMLVQKDNSKIEGIISKSVLKQKIEDIIYLERIGYCRIDNIVGNKIILFFSYT